MQSRGAAVGSIEHVVAYPELALARDEPRLGIELELRESNTHGGNSPRHVRMAGSGTRLVVEDHEPLQPARVGRLQLAQCRESDPSRSQSLEQRGEGVNIYVRDVELEQHNYPLRCWSRARAASETEPRKSSQAANVVPVSSRGRRANE